MRKKGTYLFGGLLLALFAGFSLASFNKALTPYVGFAAARADGARTVQVAGGLLAGSSSYDEDAGALLFTLSDPESGERLPVLFAGLKPANFEEAVSIVAIGRYDDEDGVFRADKLLVKCPSKYQGAEVKEYG
jgi:cytochrome c-type biogenesis protein CcmE